MPPVDLTIAETVAILTLNSGENRFNPNFLRELLAMLDRVEHETDARSLLVTSAHEKIFSNGIDLDWLVPVLHQGDLDAGRAFFSQMNDLFRRLLTYPLITVAAISGHAFAGGAILSCCFDFRFMRSDRGFFCLPEVDLGIPFLPGMNAILGKAIPRHLLEEMQLTGCRLTAADCLSHHVVRAALPADTLCAEALAFAQPLKKKRSVVGELKRRLNRSILQIMESEDPPLIASGVYHIA